jgi:hypothetical protein
MPTRGRHSILKHTQTSHSDVCASHDTKEREHQGLEIWNRHDFSSLICQPLIMRQFCPDNSIRARISGNFAQSLLSTNLSATSRSGCYARPLHKSTIQAHSTLLGNNQELLMQRKKLSCANNGGEIKSKRVYQFGLSKCAIG